MCASLVCKNQGNDNNCLRKLNQEQNIQRNLIIIRFKSILSQTCIYLNASCQHSKAAQQHDNISSLKLVSNNSSHSYFD